MLPCSCGSLSDNQVNKLNILQYSSSHTKPQERNRVEYLGKRERVPDRLPKGLRWKENISHDEGGWSLELNIGQGRRIGQVQTIINRDIYSTLHLIIRISLTRFGHFHKQRLISQTHLPRRNASYFISQTPSINLLKTK